MVRQKSLVVSLLGASLAVAGCSGGSSGGGSSASTTTGVAPSTSGTHSTPAPHPSPSPSPRPSPSPSPTPPPVAAPSPLALPSGSQGGPVARGVDVSVYQGTVDWAKAANAGLSFAIARVSDGTTTADHTFAPNWSGMKTNGLVRGVYQFFRASQDPKAQADYLVTQVANNGGFGAGDLPPCLDIETLDGQSASTVVTKITSWMDEIRAQTGLDPLIYSSPSFWGSLGSPSFSDQDDLWIANWGVSSPHIPQTWRSWTFWQDSDNGSVAGISGGVDTDAFNGTVQDLQAYAQVPVTGFYRGLAPDSTGQGYWMAAIDGGVFPYGDATFRGTPAGQTLAQPVLGLVRTPTGLGYWLFTADGNVFTYGDAVAAGNLAASTVPAPIVGLAATPTGQGYWLAGQDGTVSNFGDATAIGQPAAGTLTGQVVGIAPTPTGKGYWLAAHDGSVYPFGDAVDEGSLAGQPLTAPVVGIAATTTGKGYWLACADGSFKNFGDAQTLTYQGTRSLAAGANVVSITPSLTGLGFWLVADDGTVLAYGDAHDAGARAR